MVGQAIKKFRKEKGLSQSELAVRAGVDKSYLHSIERKVYLNPSIESLENISAALEISVDTLLHESSLEPFDPVWEKIVLEALQAGLTTEEYIEFLESNSSNFNKRMTI